MSVRWLAADAKAGYLQVFKDHCFVILWQGLRHDQRLRFVALIVILRSYIFTNCANSLLTNWPPKHQI